MFALLGGLFLALAPCRSFAAKADWDPVTAEELAGTECKFSPGASAEMLFVRQVLDSSGDNEWTEHYRRIKIYSAKGAEEMGVMNIDYPSAQRVWNQEARVIKPDGTTTTYDKKQFTESVAAQQGSTKLKRLTLAIPALEAGDILELKWAVGVDSDAYFYNWWYAQLNLPIRRYNFQVQGSLNDYSLLWFNATNEVGKQASRQKAELSLSFLPPYEEEPFMPPMRDVRGWFLLLYKDRALRWYSDQDVWKSISSYYEEDFRLLTRPDGTIKAKAAELLKGVASEEEKLRVLYNFCQQKVTNLDYFDSADLQKARKRLEKEEEQSPRETLTRGSGYSHHINELFGALLRAAGYEVALARSASRHRTLNVRNPNGWLFMNDDLIFVRSGNGWLKYAPGDHFVPAGLLDPSNELATSLVCTEDKAVFVDNGLAAADQSPVARKGRFVLDAEGNLEGTVEIAQSGHPAVKGRKRWHSRQQEEIDREYVESVTARLASAEVAGLAWESLGDNRTPLITRYQLKVPAYADVVGSKIILPMNVFQRNATAVFASEHRQHPIFFDYAWTELDDIEIVLPEGYELDAPTAPKNVGDVAGAVGATYRIAYQPKTRTLVYKRNFVLGANGNIAYQVASYPMIKRLFDSIKRSDEHTLVLRTVESMPAVSAN